MEGAVLVEDCAGITFGVELYVPWEAPEAVVDIHSEGVGPLGVYSRCILASWPSAGCDGKPYSTRGDVRSFLGSGPRFAGTGP